MVSFESLLLDIKVLILKNIPETDSLLSLILASREFNNVFQEFKHGILSRVYRNEIHQYAIEAFIIQRYKKPLSTYGTSQRTVREVLSMYGDARAQQIFIEHYLSHSGTCSGGCNIDWPELVKHHKAILRFCKTYVEKEMRGITRKDDEEVKAHPVTLAEKERIVRASYRLWLIVLFWQCRNWEDRDAMMGLPIEDSFYLFDTWHFWDVMAIIAIMEFLYRKLLPFVNQRQDDRGLQDVYMRRIAEEGLGTRNDIPNISKTQFALIMWKDFPLNINFWIERSHEPERGMERIRVIQPEEWDIRSRKDTTDMRTAAVATWRDRFFGYINRAWVIDLELVKDIWRETTPKRLCKPGHHPFYFGEETGSCSWVRPFLEKDKDINSIDFSACLWDDARLERWGYVMPEFLSEEETKKRGLKRDIFNLDWWGMFDPVYT
ncbi:hypothetical protein AA313_de0203509 [Arthrobotrys entomopaga]|nr:hypothetical protein AA313_de0203509 [Arthrobotrys entomopaga]